MVYGVHTIYTPQDGLPSAVPRVNSLVEYIRIYTPRRGGISNTYMHSDYTSMRYGVCGAQLTLQSQICLDRRVQLKVQTLLP